MWKQARMQILHNETNRDPQFEDRVLSLMRRSTSRSDEELLDTFMNMSTADQHKILIRKKPYLRDMNHDTELKTYSPLIKEFYMFSFPTDMEMWFRELESSRNKKAVMHDLAPSDEYTVSKDDIDFILETSIDTIRIVSISTIKQYFEVVVALQILTGRRSTEIINSLQIQQCPHKYQALVKGILKDFTRLDTVITIPLLYDYETIENALNIVREYRDYSELSNIEIHNATSSSVLNASVRLFNRRLTHTQKRNIYAEIAFSQRMTHNLFFPICSKEAWVSLALGHSTGNSSIGTTQRYQLMNINLS